MAINKAVGLSNRQYNLAEFFYQQGNNYVMDIETIGTYDQRTAGSLAMRTPSILERVGKAGLRLSAHGRDVVRAFHDTNIFRANPSLDLSTWLEMYLHGAPDKELRRYRRGRRTSRTVRTRTATGG